MSLVFCSTGSWETASKKEAHFRYIPPSRPSTEARSNRNPSTCIASTQYRSESITSRIAGGVDRLKELPQPVQFM
jgi:hypothetical protein